MSLRLLPAYALLTAFTSILSAETLCPGKTVGLPTRFIQDSLMVVSIGVNHRGPYDFLVDTGAQISTVDSSLASELRLQVQGSAEVSGPVTYGRRGLATLDVLAAGEKSVEGLTVVIQDLSQLKSADPHVRGILGDNFLERFDLLIDNRRKILCLDETDTLALGVGGEHVALTEPYGPSTDLPFTKPILVAASNPALGERLLNLRIDSGANVAMLHRTNPQVTMQVSPRTPALRYMVEGVERAFAILPRSDLAIGSHRLHKLSFVVPIDTPNSNPTPREDGILPTCGFKSVFISPSRRYATFETW